MAEEVVEPTVEPVVEPVVVEPEEKSVDDKIKEAMAGIETRFKGEISGLNRRNSELEKELENEKIAHMSDKEKLEFEKDKRDKELAEREAKLVEAERKNLVTSSLAEKNLDLSVSSLMTTPKTADELTEWLTTFEAKLNAEVEKQVNVRLSSGKGPKSGGKPGEKITLNSKEDASKASEEDFLAYLNQEMEDET